MNRKLLVALLLLTGIRLALIGRQELTFDEAYYHEWSQRLDWCYFSKGPGIALAMKASTALFGHGEFGIRAFAPLLALGSTLLLYWLARRLHGERVAVWTAVAMNCTPLFNAGGLLMTIDPLSIFFWVAALCTLWLALEKSPAFSLWWPASGAIIGMGFACKFTNAMQLLSVLLLLLLTPRYRRDLRVNFWTCLAAFLPFVWPIYQWNAEHGWPTTAHLAARGGLEKPWWHLEWDSFGAFLIGHFGVYSPLLFAAMAWVLVASCKDSLLRWTGATAWAVPAIPASIRRRPAMWLAATATLLGLYFFANAIEEPGLHKFTIILAAVAALVAIATLKDEPNMHWKPRFLLAFTIPLLAMNLRLALRHDCELNWTAPACVTLVILTVAHFGERLDGALRKITLVALGIGAAISILAANTDIIRAAGISFPFQYDPTARMRGWAQAAKVVADYRAKVEQQLGRPVFLIANNYGNAAALGYYLPEKRVEGPGHPPVYVPESGAAENQFHFWPGYDQFEARDPKVPINEDQDSREYGINRFAGRTALYVSIRPAHEKQEGAPASVLIPSFFKKPDPEKAWTEQPQPHPWRQFTEFELRQAGQPLKKVRIFLLPNYQPGKMLD